MSSTLVVDSPASATDLPPERPTTSLMRTFLELWDTFTWPDDERSNKKAYFEFRQGGRYNLQDLMRFERRLDAPTFRKYTKAQMVKQYRVVDSMRGKMKFHEPFAVKGLTRNPRTPDEIIKEAEAMRGLRHPHVAALLGTFYHETIDHIVTFPAGCCDLRDLLDCISRKIEGKTITEEIDAACVTMSKAEKQLEQKYSCIFLRTLDQQLADLQGYFLCLCSGLAYIHDANVRHKDIKPENIIVDYSGSVVFVDFGTSAKYATAQQSATMDPKTPATPKYMPPERDRNEVRDPRSDVYTLGCVFVEMITLLFGQTLEAYVKHYARKIPKTGYLNEDYYQNLPAVNTWLNKLIDCDFRGPCHGNKVKLAITKIKDMVQDKKDCRPYSKDLWKAFDYAPQRCKDCHPIAKTWNMTPTQQITYDEGQKARAEITEAQNETDVTQVVASTGALDFGQSSDHLRAVSSVPGSSALERSLSQNRMSHRRTSFSKPILKSSRRPSQGPRSIDDVVDQGSRAPSPSRTTSRPLSQTIPEKPHNKRSSLGSISDNPRFVQFVEAPVVQESDKENAIETIEYIDTMKGAAPISVQPERPRTTTTSGGPTSPRELQLAATGKPLHSIHTSSDRPPSRGAIDHKATTASIYPRSTSEGAPKNSPVLSSGSEQVPLNPPKPSIIASAAQHPPRAEITLHYPEIFSYNLSKTTRKVVKSPYHAFEDRPDVLFFPLCNFDKFNIRERDTTGGQFDLPKPQSLLGKFASWIDKVALKPDPAVICIYGWSQDRVPQWIQPLDSPSVRIEPVRLKYLG